MRETLPRSSFALLLLLLLPARSREAEPRAEALRALEDAQKAMSAGTPAARQRARELLRAPLAWSTRSGDPEVRARAAALTANTYAADNEPRQAISWYEHSRLAAIAAKDERQRVRAVHNIAIQRWMLGDAGKALTELEALLPARRALNDQPGLGYTWLGIAAARFSLGDTAAALDGFRQALQIWQAVGDIANQAQAHNSLGLILDQLGDTSGARTGYDEALPLWRKAGHRVGEGMTLNNLCLWSIGRRAYREAIPFCEQAQPLLDAAGDRRSSAYVRHNLGSAYAGLGEHRKAIDLYEQALAAKRQIGDRWGEAASLQAIGESFIALGEAKAGRVRINQALQLRLAAGDRAGQIQTRGVLARLHRDAGELDEARAQAEQAIAGIEATRASLASQDRRASFFAGRRDYYELLAGVLARMQRHEAAVEAAERARGRQLLDRLSDSLAGLQRGVDPALLARRRALEQRIHARIERLERANGGMAALADVDAVLAESRDLEEQIRRASPRYAGLTQPVAVRFTQVRSLLDANTVLIEYLVGSERSHAWLVTSAGVRYAVLPARDELDRRMKSLFNAVSVREIRFDQEAAELRDMLLGPFRNEITAARRLLIAADGAIESAPFAALAPDKEVVQVPSVSALALLRTEAARRVPAPRLIAIVADPVFGGDLPRLRFSRLEADSVAAIAGPATQSALGLEASREWLTRAPLRDFQILHFATHALADTSRPALSGIQLSRVDAAGRSVDGFLRLPEIYNLDLRARLVVLSACRSATGADLPGEGLVSLTRAFLYAGAAGVVATLWDVDDRATAELMQRFYEGLLKRKLPPGQALQEARQSLRAEPRWQHPYYWAGVTLHGEWR
jgi:CHAT domain-containing protein/Tfp pilus assembly protein PilF